MKPSRQAFTLIEVLLVVALGGLLLTAIAALVFSTVQLTQEARTQPHFRTHVSGVLRHVDSLLQQANDQPVASAGTDNREVEDNRVPRNVLAQGSAGSANALRWDEPPGSDLQTEACLAFTLNGEQPIFQDEEFGNPYDPQVWLLYDEDAGLVLRWQSAEMIREEDREAYRVLLLSPLVTGLTYHFYDPEEEEWESIEHDEDPDPEMGLPSEIEFAFTSRQGEILKRSLFPPGGTTTEVLY